jgi:hypothetical protein
MRQIRLSAEQASFVASAAAPFKVCDHDGYMFGPFRLERSAGEPGSQGGFRFGVVSFTPNRSEPCGTAMPAGSLRPRRPASGPAGTV